MTPPPFLPPCSLPCRDKTRRAACPIVVVRNPDTGKAKACVAEPYTMYRLPSGGDKGMAARWAKQCAICAL